MTNTNPEVIKFLNEVVRPNAEILRALKAKYSALDVKWAQIIELVPANADLIDDGREAEGVTRLTNNDVRDLMYGIMAVIKPAIEGLAASTIEKPCVRVLETN